MSAQHLTPTDRDRDIVRAAWSLGAASPDALAGLVCPGTSAKTVHRRLRRLTTAGYLARTQVAGRPGGVRWIYTAGARARMLDPAYAGGWRPPLVQVEHTVLAGELLARLVTREWDGLAIVGWQGEAEVRQWTAPSDPRPDAIVDWHDRHGPGRWYVEVDRGTEAQGAWRRKLVRYFATADGSRAAVLAITTRPDRARAIARLAADVGVPLLATTPQLLDTDGLAGAARSRPDVPLPGTTVLEGSADRSHHRKTG